MPNVLTAASIAKKLGKQWALNAKRSGLALASGPSGVGKSILMHQVVVPSLRLEAPETLITSFMPGDDPQGFFASLWEALGNLPPDVSKGSSKALSKWFRHSTDEHLLVIDGLDQIFDPQSNEGEAAKVISFLWEISQFKTVTIIATLRCPFREPTMRLFPKGVSADTCFVSLPILNAEERHTLARESIRLASSAVETEDPATFERLVRKVADELDQAPRAMPFLTPLLERWRAQVACGDTSIVNWLRSGGLAGEIASHLNQRFTSLKPRLQRQLEPLLRVLFSWSDELMPSSVAVPFADIQALGPDAVELTNVLLYERVLFLAGDDPLHARVQLVHPRTVDHWPLAKEMLSEMRRDMSVRRLLDAQALRWDSNGRRPEDQWLDGELALTAQTLLQRETTDLPRVTRDFLQTFEDSATGAQDAPLGRLRQLVKSLSLIGVLIVLGIGLAKTPAIRSGDTPNPIMEASAQVSPNQHVADWRSVRKETTSASLSALGQTDSLRRAD